MNRSILRRLARLEAAHPVPFRPWHEITIEESEDPEPLIAAMIAAGEAQKGDHVVINVIVDPRPEQVS